MEIKAGLEIHQQLDTHKLFCSCPSLLRNDKPLFVVKRRLNAVAGETGEIDEAVLHEAMKNKLFIYEAYDTTCLVELDEEPPHKINEEALKIAIQIALMLNCKILKVSQVMRKTVIDGSNTSGFQRTVLIAHDGYVETKEGKVRIGSVALEEDSARKVFEDETSKTYRLDRLGIPLVEITTKPDLKSPEQIKETALKIGEILRACKVKRGIGTIRQDLNISIKGSKRVEIKGFQDPRMMITTINKEIERQKNCVKNKNCKSEVRKANPDGSTTFLRPMPGKARMYPETDVPLLKISRELIDEAKRSLPKSIEEQRKFLAEKGLNPELVRLVLKQKALEDFEYLLNVKNEPQLIAKMLCVFPKEIARKQGILLEEVRKRVNLDVLESILEEVDKSISEADVRNVMGKIVQGSSLKEALEKPAVDLDSEVKELLKKKPGLNFNAYMGLIMGKFKGQVSGREVSEVLKKYIGNAPGRT